jgi:hypothetical protein
MSQPDHLKAEEESAVESPAMLPCPFCGQKAKIRRKELRETIRHSADCMFVAAGIFDQTPQWVDPLIWNQRHQNNEP